MSLMLIALLLGGLAPAQVDSGARTASTAIDPFGDPTAEDEEHRPVNVPEQGTNERLIEDIAAATGEVTLPEVVDEILGDVVAELAERPAKWMTPLAIRNLALGANVEPGYAPRLKSAIIAAIHAGTDVRVVECLECQATRTEIVGTQWVVTRGVVNGEQSRQVAERLGVRTFMDVAFGFEPASGTLQMDFSLVRARDGVVLWADTFRADETTPMLMRSSFAPQRRKDRLRDLEMLLEGRPLYGYMANAGYMVLPYDDPINGDIGGATAGYRIYERFGVDRQVMFGLDLMGFINTERLAGGVLSAGSWWVFPRPDLINPELRLGAKAGAFIAGSQGNAAVFQLGAELLLRYRFGLYGYLLFMTKSELEPGRFLGGLGFATGISFNW